MNKIDTLQALQIYRSNLNSNLNYPGWTVWALSGSLVTLFWLLIGLWSDSNLILVDSLRISFIIYFLYPYVSFVFAHDYNSQQNNVEPTYYFFKAEITSQRYKLFFDLAVVSYMFYCVNFLDFLDGIYLITFNLLFGVMMISLVLYMIVAYVSLPLPKKSTGKPNKIVSGIGFLVLKVFPIVIATGFFLQIENIELVSIESLKVGMLLFAIFYIIKVLLSLKKNVPIIKAIDGIIDDLMFDTIQPEEANKKLELIVHGISFKELILPQLTSVLNLNREFDLLCEKVTETILLYDSTKASDGDSTRLKESLKESMIYNVEKLKSITTNLSNQTKKIIFRLRTFPNYQKYSDDYEIVIKQMEEGLASNQSKIDHLDKQFES